MKKVILILILVISALSSQAQFITPIATPAWYHKFKVDQIFWLATSDTTEYSAATYPGALAFQQIEDDTAIYYSNGIKWVPVGSTQDLSRYALKDSVYFRHYIDSVLANRMPLTPDTIHVSDSIWLNGKWVKGFSSDSTLGEGSDNVLPTQEAVKSAINQISFQSITNKSGLTNNNINIGGGNDTSVTFQVSTLGIDTFTFKSKNVAAHQGYAYDGKNHYIIGTTYIYKYDSLWNVSATNLTLAEDLALSHCGDGDIYNGKLYIPIENWFSDCTFNTPKIARIDTADLSVIDTNYLPTQGIPIGCITIGDQGEIYGGSYCEDTALLVFNTDFTFRKFITLKTKISFIQGISYKDGLIWVSNRSGFFYAIDTLGNVYPKGRDNVYSSGWVHEGIEIVGDTLRCLADSAGKGTNSYLLSFPIDQSVQLFGVDRTGVTNNYSTENHYGDNIFESGVYNQRSAWDRTQLIYKPEPNYVGHYGFNKDHIAFSYNGTLSEKDDSTKVSTGLFINSDGSFDFKNDLIPHKKISWQTILSLSPDGHLSGTTEALTDSSTRMASTAFVKQYIQAGNINVQEYKNFKFGYNGGGIQVGPNSTNIDGFFSLYDNTGKKYLQFGDLQFNVAGGYDISGKQNSVNLGTSINAGNTETFHLYSSTGNASFIGTMTAAKYQLSDLNTAPSSATDTGTKGEIRITSDYIYVCIATNTWVRAALSTW